MSHCAKFDEYDLNVTWRFRNINLSLLLLINTIIVSEESLVRDRHTLRLMFEAVTVLNLMNI